jgi:glycosyltransferase involved in cell wall biosynthesis
VESALSQTYRNLEIILVDDGSPDSCPELCDALAKQDGRIRVLHQKHAGVSAARNAGIATATGELIFFLDSDDQIMPDTIESLAQMRSDTQADISIIAITPVKEDEEVLPTTSKMLSAIKITSIEAQMMMLYQKEFDTSPCGKLVPAAIMKRYLFPVGRNYEDLAIVFRWLMAVDTVVYCTERKYRYTQNPDGIISQSFALKNALDEKQAMDELFAAMTQESPNMMRAAKSRRFSAYCHILLSISCKETQNQALKKDIRSVLRKDSVTVMQDTRARSKNRIGAAVYTIAGEVGIRIVFTMIKKLSPSVDRNLNRMFR